MADYKHRPIWFARRPSGFGWRPVTWQGRLVCAVFVVIVAGATLWFAAHLSGLAGDNRLLRFLVGLVEYALIVIGATTALLGVCYTHEPARPS